MTRTRSATTKLVGWSILAGAAVLIVGIFLITRAASPSAPGPAATVSTAAAPSSAAPAASQPPEPPSSEVAPSSTALASSSAQPASSSSELVVVDAAAMDQGARKALLNTLINQGVFTGIQALGSPPKVGVTPLFQGLNPDLQRQFIATVYTYVNNGTAGNVPLQLIDATTGKVIGNYTTADGLKLL